MAIRTPPRAAGFRLLGFPVRVRLGFLFVAVIFLGRGEFRLSSFLFAIAAYTFFMMVHELGHAVAARQFGCTDVAISLDFLVGYAMFRPPADITRKRLAAISLAGPFTEIVSGLAVLLAMGANLTSFRSMTQGSRFDVFWFGPLLGLANLIPILPLDGGNVVSLLFERLNPTSGRRVFQMVSLGLSGMLAVFGLLQEQSGGRFAFLLLPGVLLSFMNFSALQSGRSMPTQSSNVATAPVGSAEDQAWVTGVFGNFPSGVTPSPWLLAADAVRRGDHANAHRMILDSMTRPTGYWQLSDAAPHSVLLSLVDLVQEPLPVENLHGARTFHHVLHRLGFLRRAAEYGGLIFQRHQDPFTAHQVATELALLGHPDQAMGWLQSALIDPDERARLTDSALDSLRSRPDFVSLMQALPPPRR